MLFRSNGAAGVYLGYTYETTFCGGFSENNTAALNVSANAVRVHYYGRRTIDSIVGTTNSASSFFTTDDFTVDASGNIAATSIATSAELPIQNTVAKIYAGGSTPNGRITASPGSLFLYTGGGASTTLWVKESGTGDVGWVAK